MRPLILATALLAATPALAQTPAAPETRSCLLNRDIQETRMSKAHELFAKTGAKAWWRNTKTCDAFQPNNSWAHQTPMNSVCSGESVQVFTSSRFGLGGCTLGKWERVDPEVALNATK